MHWKSEKVFFTVVLWWLGRSNTPLLYHHLIANSARPPLLDLLSYMEIQVVERLLLWVHQNK